MSNSFRAQPAWTLPWLAFSLTLLMLRAPPLEFMGTSLQQTPLLLSRGAGRHRRLANSRLQRAASYCELPFRTYNWSCWGPTLNHDLLAPPSFAIHDNVSVLQSGGRRAAAAFRWLLGGLRECGAMNCRMVWRPGDSLFC
eukprot:TRINITY_DN23631_c0_g1_i5.p1 TRINITY_DN23631_c0_g1~~TRINITY_DN23631_c0_g1_i5.p1  ORF type:complete len:148 (+),score=15.74 TRINITY_DN23631_c0_g1_i5:27-446(+)